MVTGYLIVIALATLALTRLPSAVSTTRNVPVLLASAAVVVAFALITPGVYGGLSPLIPVPNVVDLVAKLFLFVGLMLAGATVARAHDASGALRLVVGWPGVVVFLVAFLADIAIFAVVHTGELAPDLALNLSSPLVRIYSTIATAYPAYIAAVLMPLMWRGLSSSVSSSRWTSRFLVVGFGLALVRFVIGLVTIATPAMYQVGQVVSGFAAVAVALGLATAFFARSARDRQARRQFS